MIFVVVKIAESFPSELLPVLNLFRTFAAMDTKKKRHIASWVLLAVFLPMLVFSSLHIHQSEGAVQMTYAECVHHHCGGHLWQQTISMDDCVLCQFLTLPILAVAVATLIIYNQSLKAEPQTWQRSVCVAHNSVVGLRAPPSI